jgi:hypothetical protein
MILIESCLCNHTAEFLTADPGPASLWQTSYGQIHISSNLGTFSVTDRSRCESLLCQSVPPIAPALSVFGLRGFAAALL